MGCAPSSNNTAVSGTGTRTNNQTDDTTYNTNTNTNTTNGGAKYPDDNAIYGCDLYGDDAKNKNDGGGGDGGETNTKTNANEMQYDDAGFYGETDKEKQEVELFDGTGDKKADETQEEEGDRIIEQKAEDTSVIEPDVIPPPPADDEAATECTESKEDAEPPVEPEPEQEQEPEAEPEEIPGAQAEPPAKKKAPKKKKGCCCGGGGGDDDEEDDDDDEMIKVGGYTPTETGLMVLSKDFRTKIHDDNSQDRPKVKEGDLYTDAEFGLKDAITDSATRKQLKWKRPQEFCSDPKLFTEGTTRFDIGQGSAGTCWFLSTVANISNNKALLKQVIPDGAYPVGTDDYQGMFHARFWSFGKWLDVYIDDFMPVVYEDQLWGARSDTDDNELWVALLEKAFARSHGSYNAVYGGQPGDAYLALTGGVAERIDFEENDDKSEKVFQRIQNAVRSGADVTCVVPDEHHGHLGLVGGHAYSLSGTAEANGTKLLRVRNPWGNTEWQGDWSDGSPQWDGVDDSVPRAVIDDGEFYICLEDFMEYFSQSTVCSLTPDFDMDGYTDALNYVTNLYGEWKGKTAAGFRDKLKNPVILFTVPASDYAMPIVVQLIQRRHSRKVEYFQVRCDMYKVFLDTGSSCLMEIMGENTNKYSPEAQCSFRHKASPGTYAIVPSTSEAGQENSFFIRLFSSGPIKKITELPEGHKLMSCAEQSKIVEVDGETFTLKSCVTLPGEWKAGVNAGGQISHKKTHANNPQIILTVSEETPVKIQMVQVEADPKLPLGLRLFKSGDAPLSYDQLMEMHDEAVEDIDGEQFKFIQAWDLDTTYMLTPGEYTLILHSDEPDTEKIFALIIKSPHHVDVRGYNMGA